MSSIVPMIKSNLASAAFELFATTISSSSKPISCTVNYFFLYIINYQYKIKNILLVELILI